MSVYRVPAATARLPRAIERRWGAGTGARLLVRLFTLPQALVGLCLTVRCVTGAALALAGADVVGHVTRTWESQPRSRHPGAYHVEYRYTQDGRELTGERSLALSMKGTFDVGRPVRVRSSSTLGAALIVPGESEWSATQSVPLSFVLFWDGLMAVFLYLVWYVPLRQRWLYRWGTTAPGRVTLKSAERGQRGGTAYSVAYEFTTGWGEACMASMQVSSHELWREVSEGDPVTVLHDPRRARPSVVYECGDYQWREPQ